MTFLYIHFLKPILFKFDPEKVHDHFLKVGTLLGRYSFFKWILSKLFLYKNSVLEQKICGINFQNPVGLAGGFDKNACLVDVLPSVGFGYIEVGSITALPYAGNSGLRLKRFPKTKSIWVNYGMPNIGAAAIHKNLLNKKFKLPVFFNIAKTNCKATIDRKVGVADYVTSLEIFKDMAEVFTINVSCPNAYGGEPFHNVEDLDALLKAITELKLKQIVFLKISPELPFESVDKLLKVCDKYQVDGLILGNLRKKKEDLDFAESERGMVAKYGGMSGKYQETHSNQLLKYIALKVKHNECKKYVLIGLGGIFTAQDAYTKIKLGASLVQLITGMIFNGPAVISDINKGIVELLRKDGFDNISDAIGVDL